MYIACIFIVYYLLVVLTNVYIFIKILNHITNAPTRFGAPTPPSGSFDIAFTKVINY